MTSVSTVPVSCKIRVLRSREDTLEFAKMLEQCGISALAVHGRQRDERPMHKNRADEIMDVARSLSIPVLANGGSADIKAHDDIARFKTATGASGVLVARTALMKPSIFRKEGLLPMDQVLNF